MLVCSSPKLIAAYHVLHRLSDPRHPPYALICFKKFKLYSIDCILYMCNLLVITTFYSQYVKELKSKYSYRIIEIDDDKIMNLQTLSQHHNKYKNHFNVEDIGVEPMTLCVQGRCSSQLS